MPQLQCQAPKAGTVVGRRSQLGRILIGLSWSVYLQLCSLMLCNLAGYMHRGRQCSSKDVHFSLHCSVYKMLYCASHNIAEMHRCADIVQVTAMLELPWQLACHASPAPF